MPYNMNKLSPFTTPRSRSHLFKAKLSLSSQSIFQVISFYHLRNTDKLEGLVQAGYGWVVFERKLMHQVLEALQSMKE